MFADLLFIDPVMLNQYMLHVEWSNHRRYVPLTVWLSDLVRSFWRVAVVPRHDDYSATAACVKAAWVDSQELLDFAAWALSRDSDSADRAARRAIASRDMTDPNTVRTTSVFHNPSDEDPAGLRQIMAHVLMERQSQLGRLGKSIINHQLRCIYLIRK
jgi:hypothetical protein